MIARAGTVGGENASDPVNVLVDLREVATRDLGRGGRGGRGGSERADEGDDGVEGRRGLGSGDSSGEEAKREEGGGSKREAHSEQVSEERSGEGV